MSFDELCRRAAAVREIALDRVLLQWGAERDRHDPSKWRTEEGPVSVTGSKFMNWRRDQGGGGAIDLVMHLAGTDFRAAVAWLEHHFGVGHLAVGQAGTAPCFKQRSAPAGHGPLRLPVRDDRMLDRVREYLTRRRHLAASLLESLLACGKLYADRRGNAVFLLVAGKAQRPVGAELRGSGPRVWRGMAPGTCKDLGYFWIGAAGSKNIVLCESAIDAISCLQMHPERICISTSGVRANPPWLAGLLTRGHTIHCGFDADAPGHAAAEEMIALYPSINRLRPPAHDWNDALAANQ
jgi:hypothetical protein